MTSTAIAKKETFSDFMTSPNMRRKITEMISGKDADNFITTIIAAVSQNPDLQTCEKMSILSSALQGQALKLSPSPKLGHFYLVPFKNHKIKKDDGSPTVEAQFVMGYKGYIQLAIRSNQYKKINVLSLKEGEVAYWNPLTEDLDFQLIEDEWEREKTPNSHYYGFFEYHNGFKKAICWTHKRMILHAEKYVPGFNNVEYERLLKTGDHLKSLKYWYKDFEGQALKTILRQLISKWGIMSIEMQTAFESDIDSQERMASEENQHKPIVSMTEIMASAKKIATPEQPQ